MMASNSGKRDPMTCGGLSSKSCVRIRVVLAVTLRKLAFRSLEVSSQSSRPIISLCPYCRSHSPSRKECCDLKHFNNRNTASGNRLLQPAKSVSGDNIEIGFLHLLPPILNCTSSRFSYFDKRTFTLHKLATKSKLLDTQTIREQQIHT